MMQALLKTAKALIEVIVAILLFLSWLILLPCPPLRRRLVRFQARREIRRRTEKVTRELAAKLKAAMKS